jgi:hypothetical protein
MRERERERGIGEMREREERGSERVAKGVYMFI